MQLFPLKYDKDDVSQNQLKILLDSEGQGSPRRVRDAMSETVDELQPSECRSAHTQANYVLVLHAHN